MEMEKAHVVPRYFPTDISERSYERRVMVSESGALGVDRWRFRAMVDGSIFAAWAHLLVA